MRFEPYQQLEEKFLWTTPSSYLTRTTPEPPITRFRLRWWWRRLSPMAQLWSHRWERWTLQTVSIIEKQDLWWEYIYYNLNKKENNGTTKSTKTQSINTLLLPISMLKMDGIKSKYARFHYSYVNNTFLTITNCLFPIKIFTFE